MSRPRQTGCCGDPRVIPDHTRSLGRPLFPSRLPKCGDGFTYRIGAGDSIYALGREFGVPWQAIYKANPHLGSPNSLRVGTVICIPTAHVPRCPDGVLEELEPGETPRRAASRLGVSVEGLLNLNPQVTDPDTTWPGQRLCVRLKQEGGGVATNG